MELTKSKNTINNLDEIVKALELIADDYLNAKTPITKNIIVDAVIHIFNFTILAEKGILKEVENEDGDIYYEMA